MKYTDSKIKDFLNDLSSKKPVPGGGAASALVCAAGVSCIMMVINYTIGKQGYEKYNTKLKVTLNKLLKIKNEVRKCIDLDVLIFDKIAKIYKLPKNTKKQINFRKKKLRKFLVKVNSVERNIIKLSLEAIKLTLPLLNITNKNLVSDLGCGVLFLKSSSESALLNIKINAKSLKHKKIDRTISMTEKIVNLSDKFLKQINFKLKF